MRKAKVRATQNSDSTFTIDGAVYNELINLLDELAFRGKMQEALVVRIANKAGFTEVLERIKRRRLYTKRMGVGAPAGDDGAATNAPKARGNKKTKKRSRMPPRTDVDTPEGDTEGME